MENNVLEMEKLKKEKEAKQRQDYEDYKKTLNKVFKSDEGQVVLKQMALNSGFFSQTVNIEHQNALFYQIGKKKMFMDIFHGLDNDCKKKLIDNLFITK